VIALDGLPDRSQEVIPTLPLPSPQVQESDSGRSYRVLSLLRTRQSRIGLAITLGMLIYAIVVPIFGSSSGQQIDPGNAFQSPGLVFLHPGQAVFGTDHLGRSLAVTTALGLRTSILIGVAAVALASAVGWFVGAVSGFVGGAVEDLGGRLMDLFSAFPGLLLAVSITAAIGGSAENVVIVLALVSWVTYGKVARAEALGLRQLAFIEAAKVNGLTTTQILWRHVRKNTSQVISALCIIDLPRMVIGEATLSFLGFGIQPPTISLGALIASERDFIQVSPWAATFPGVVLSLLCIGLATLGLGLGEQPRRGLRRS
jgi:peptide/nickel transport system permease protein